MPYERFWTLSNRPTFILALTTFYKSTRPQSGSQEKTLPKSSQTMSKLSVFSSKYIGKKPYEKTHPLRPDSPDRDSKTKRHLQTPGLTRSVSTALKDIHLKKYYIFNKRLQP